MPKFQKNTNYKMKKSKATFDFGSKNQGLNKAKAKARKRVGEMIFKEDASHESTMAKGRRMNQAMTEINKYTDY